MRVVIGMVEVPVGVDDAFHRSVANAIESLFELGPGGRNKSVHHEFAVWAVEDYHGSAGAVEHSDIVSELLRFHGNGVELPHPDWTLRALISEIVCFIVCDKIR